MGRALPPQQDAGEWELQPQGSRWRAGGRAPPAATLRVLILTLLWRGSLAQPPGFTLTVPQSVSVQEGLCVLVPCTFTYPASYDTDNPQAQLYRYWYKDQGGVRPDPLVASTDPSWGVSQETQGRFRLVENPAHGDCSLQISDARRTDLGRYYFRFEKGSLKYSYLTNSDGTDAKLAISVTGLTEEPEIQISLGRGLPVTLLAGEPVNVTCTAPGRCSGPPPRVTWTGPFSDTARDVSAQLANGTWARSSALSFTPGPGDHGKELVCNVTYRPPQGPSTRRTVRLHINSLERTLQITVSRANRSDPQLFQDPSTKVANGSQLSAQEGDSLRFLCSVASSPPAVLGWVRGGRAVEGSRPTGENQLRLELPNVTAEDGGLYGCWARNKESSAQGTFQLLVESPDRDWAELILPAPVAQRHPAAVVEAEGRTGRGPGNPQCLSPACRSGRSSAIEEPTKNWNLTGLRKWRMRPQLGALLPRVRPMGLFSPVPGPLPTPPAQTHGPGQLVETACNIDMTSR